MTRLGRTILVLAVTHLAAVPVSGAQDLYVGASLTISSVRVWRGLTRVNDLSLHPELSGALVCSCRFLGTFALSGGVWGSYAPERADSGDLSDLGPGQFGFGEVNFWVELTHPVGFLTLGAGMVAYEYHGQTPGFARTSAENTTELYAHFQAQLWRLAPSFTAYRDIRRVLGWYLEPSLAASPIRIPLRRNKNPLGTWRILFDLGGTAGFSLGQEVDAAAPGRSDLAHFAERGLTHIDFSAGITVVPPADTPILLQFAWHRQLNKDAFVRRIAGSQDANWKEWFTLSGRVGGPVVRGKGLP